MVWPRQSTRLRWGHLPLNFEITPGQVQENTSLIDLLNGTNDEVTDSNGDPVAWPAALAGDKGYRANWIDEMLVEMEINPVIPCKENEDRDKRRWVGFCFGYESKLGIGLILLCYFRTTCN